MTRVNLLANLIIAAVQGSARGSRSADQVHSLFKNCDPVCVPTGNIVVPPRESSNTRLLVTDSGMTLWSAAFADPPAVLQGASADIEDARSLFIFSRLDALDEVIFIATPHRGSPKAGGPLSRLVRQLIQGPGQALSFLSRLARDNPAHVRPGVRESYLAGGPASFETLTPTQPVSAAASLLPIGQGVRAHSIIGIKDPRHPENGDGIVSLESASWPAGETHYVRGDHAIHGAPETVLLIKRILLDRLARGDE